MDVVIFGKTFTLEKMFYYRPTYKTLFSFVMHIPPYLNIITV